MMKMNVPNTLTILRMCMVPVFVILLLNGCSVAAGIVFILASLTDTLDGYLARKYHQITVFGKFMDPLADKLLVCSALICLVDLDRIASWIVIIIVGREFIISGFRLIAAQKGVVIAAGMLGKVKTVVQMIMVILLVFNFSGWLGKLAGILVWLSLVLTVLSLAEYLYNNRDVLKDGK